MKILFVIHQFLPRHVTGTEQYVRSLARGLRDRGHDVRVFAYEPQLEAQGDAAVWIERDEDVDGIPVRRVGLHPDVVSNRQLADWSHPIAERLFRRALDGFEPDRVHVFHLRNIGVGALVEAEKAGVPVAVNLMDFWFVCPRFTLLHRDGHLCDGPPDDGLGCVPCLLPDLGPLLEPVGEPLRRTAHHALVPAGHRDSRAHRAAALVGRKERLLERLARVEAVIAPSLFLKRTFEEQGFDGDRIRHVPYGVDPARLVGHARREVVEADGVRFGYVGSLMPHKGLHVAIEALLGLDGPWVLEVHGDLDVHPAYSDRLRALVGDDPRVEFAGGFRPTDLGRVLSGFDALIAPSLWYENTPFTVLEAQMAGMPILASDLGGISEVVRSEENGLLFAVGDVAGARAACARLIDAPDVVESLRPKGPARTLDDNLDDFEALYRDLAP
ncbi:MAG: glycosyltransferase [Planctomycetota bacterium JB042]